MPVFLSERLPLPSLRSYAVISVILFAVGLFHARNVYEAKWKLNENAEQGDKAVVILETFGKDSFCLWAAVNMAYCCLFLFGEIIQRIVFGDLKNVEEQHLQEMFWNYVFYKVIFVFGVVNAQTLSEVMCWLAWFSMVGFWKIFGHLCRDRFEFIISTPSASTRKHNKLLVLLITILLSTFCMAFTAFYSNFSDSWSIFFFMLAECVLLGLECLHIIAKYVIQLMNASFDDNWERRATLIYRTDLFFECFVHGIDLAHHLHMLLWSNVFLSMASLVLYWNIRTIFSGLKRKLRKHRIYRKIIQSVQEKFLLMNEEELQEYEDNCAICWDDMIIARKLPCGHIFHQACLCSWLQQDTSCPTCRMSLASIMGLPESRPRQPNMDGDVDVRQFVELPPQGNQRNHFFHFDGSRIANWFPSFSIEVFHGANQDETSDQELEDMAHQVQTMFPNILYDVILNDIRRTHSSEETANNILELNLLMSDTNVNEGQNTQSDLQQSEVNERPAISNDEENSGLATSESAGESSDTNSQADFFDDSEKRQQALTNRRQQFITEARRRYVAKAADTTSSSEQELSTNRLLNGSTTSSKGGMNEQEEKRTRLLQAIQRRLKVDQPLQQQDANTKDVDFEEEHDVIR